jgi:hypothetical protein
MLHDCIARFPNGWMAGPALQSRVTPLRPRPSKELSRGLEFGGMVEHNIIAPENPSVGTNEGLLG